MKRKNIKLYKKIALIGSLFLIIIWGVLGTGASLAWFTDTSEQLTNIFHVAEFDLEVSHRTEDGTWETVDAQTEVFGKNALFEPGYVQVAYLKIENKGDLAFDFHTAVSINNYTVSTNVFGQRFNLQDYLRFGVTTALDEASMEETVAQRQNATALATQKLQNYHESEVATLQPGDVTYMALVVYMPEQVGNEANYIGKVVPRVDLGIIVKADQIRNQ